MYKSVINLPHLANIDLQINVLKAPSIFKINYVTSASFTTPFWLKFIYNVKTKCM